MHLFYGYPILLAIYVRTNGLGVFFFYFFLTYCTSYSSSNKSYWGISILLWGRVISGSSWITGNSTWKKSYSSFFCSIFSRQNIWAFFTSLLERLVLIFLLISSLTIVSVSMMICKFSVVSKWLMMIFFGNYL